MTTRLLVPGSSVPSAVFSESVVLFMCLRICLLIVTSQWVVTPGNEGTREVRAFRLDLQQLA